MSSTNSIPDAIGYSFSQLIKLRKKQYFDETIFENKKIIATKFICDPEISYDFLNKYIEMGKSSQNDSSAFYETFNIYYNKLQYSLSKEKNNFFYEYLKALNKLNQEEQKHDYLAKNDPINNFKCIYLKYSSILKEDSKKQVLIKIYRFYNNNLPIIQI